MRKVNSLEEGIILIKEKEKEFLDNKRRSKLSEKELVDGTKAEIEFLKTIWVLSKHGIYVSDASEDESEHWDIAIGKMRYDVKSNCSIPYGMETMWVELITRMGKKGSLYGKSNFMAFRYDDPFHFLVCSRKEVYALLELNGCLGLQRTTDKNKSRKSYVPYGRPQYKESIVRVPIKDLLGLKMSREVM